MDTQQIYIESNLMKQALRSVRDLIMSHAGSVQHTNKADGSPVTEIDILVEKTITDYMRSNGSKIPVLGEEAGYDTANLPSTCWLIDPIDGTGSFIEGSSTFTSMAALIHDNQTVAAIIYNPTENELYSAVMGEGTYRNDTILNLRDSPLPLQAYCKKEHIEPLQSLFDSLQTPIQCELAPNGGGYGFCKVAEGSSAARFQLHSRGYIHDYAPGALIIKEAGGCILPILEDNYTFRTQSFVACHPLLQEAVLSILPHIKTLENPTKTAL